jgi:hypothetical protein
MLDMSGDERFLDELQRYVSARASRNNMLRKNKPENSDKIILAAAKMRSLEKLIRIRLGDDTEATTDKHIVKLCDGYISIRKREQ